MANPIVYNSSANGSTHAVLSALGGQSIEVTTTSGQNPPTVTLDATLLAGSLNVTADSGATAIVDVVASAAGTLGLDANGGIIEASSTIGALTGTSVTIENGGTFVAESSFLSLLNSTSITFAGNSTLVLNNGGLLNLSETAPIAGFQADGDHVIDDALIQGTSVAKYSITATGQSGADVLTFLSSADASLGSLTFAAGTFNPGELGTYLVGDLSGPLKMSVGSDGGITTDTGTVLDGGGDSGALQAGGWVNLHSMVRLGIPSPALTETYMSPTPSARSLEETTRYTLTGRRATTLSVYTTPMGMGSGQRIQRRSHFERARSRPSSAAAIVSTSWEMAHR